jgi:hypothetical protein
MLADPQSVTINGTAISLPKTSDTNVSNVYSDLAGGTTFYVTQRVISEKQGPRRRASVSITREKIAADVLTAINKRVQASVTVSFAFPDGFTQTEIEQTTAGLITWLTASTNANLKKVLAGER